MRKITFGEPVLKVESLEVKFDVIPVSSSLAMIIGDRDLALIVQQLHYWTLKGYGEVIDGVRWFYKSIKEWITEVFPTFTPYQLSKLMAKLAERGIIRREKLFTKHQIQNGDRFWWQPKNQTYYYSLSTQKIQELADNFSSAQKEAETLETSVFTKTQILSDREFKDTKDFDCSKNNTDITSIENISRDRSHPTLPCESEAETEKNQRKQDSGPKGYRSAYNSELLSLEEVDSANPKVIEEDTNDGQVEENINQNISTNQEDVQKDVQVEVEKPATRPKIKTAKGTRTSRLFGGKLHADKSFVTENATVSKRIEAAPWKDEGQFKRFYRALIQAVPIVANARSPQGLAQVIIRQLKSGIPHTYWDDFINGLPIGTSTKPEWEVEPGIPHPMFIEYLVEKLIKGNNSQTREQAMVTALNIASTPKSAIFFWKECKISLGNALHEAERHRKLGVKALPTPLWTKERPEPTLAEAAIAGTKIQQINNSTQASLEAAHRADGGQPELNSGFRAAKNPQIGDGRGLARQRDLGVSPSQAISEGVSFRTVEGGLCPDKRPVQDESQKEPPSCSISSSGETPPICEAVSFRTLFRATPDPWKDDKPLTMREMLAARKVKGFCPKGYRSAYKAMPKVLKDTAPHISQAEIEKEEREQIKPKTNISQMSLAEINDYLKDPILRAQLMSQLWDSDYELITDYLGQIIGVKLSDLQIRERRRLEEESS